MYTYKLYGLTVSSDLLLPELLPTRLTADPCSADISINVGTVPTDGLVGSGKNGVVFQITPEKLLLTVPNVAHFLIQRGKEVIYQPLSDLDESNIRVYLLGSCFGALLFQRDFLVLHGNAIEVDGYCVMCVGDSGVGKSTLAAEMMRRGYRIIADDVCPIDNGGNVIPGMPRIKLWSDSADKLKIKTSSLSRICSLSKKYNYPLFDRHCDTPLPVKRIYILGKHNESHFGIERIHGMYKFTPLRLNTYRHGFLKGMNLSQTHLRQCGQLASQTKLARILRPRVGFQLEELADFILNDICQQDNVQ